MGKVLSILMNHRFWGYETIHETDFNLIRIEHFPNCASVQKIPPHHPSSDPASGGGRGSVSGFRSLQIGDALFTSAIHPRGLIEGMGNHTLLNATAKGPIWYVEYGRSCLVLGDQASALWNQFLPIQRYQNISVHASKCTWECLINVFVKT